MTTIAGKGPLPSGTARNALTSSSPDLKVISDVLTWARAGDATISIAPTHAIVRFMGSSTVATTRMPEPPERIVGRSPGAARSSECGGRRRFLSFFEGKERKEGKVRKNEKK